MSDYFYSLEFAVCQNSPIYTVWNGDLMLHILQDIANEENP